MARILIIDDDPLTRGVLQRILNIRHHSVFQAENGREGLQVISRSPVDLVITDIVMPDQDGFAVIDALKGTHPWIKVVAYSGGETHQDVGLLGKAKARGAHATMPKPFSITDLLNAVDDILSGKAWHP